MVASVVGCIGSWSDQAGHWMLYTIAVYGYGATVPSYMFLLDEGLEIPDPGVRFPRTWIEAARKAVDSFYEHGGRPNPIIVDPDFTARAVERKQPGAWSFVG